MKYIYDFDICTMLFFGLTIFFYLYQKRLRNLQDTIFTAMLIASATAVVFDFLAAYMERNALLYPIWMLYAVNTLFILGMQTCLPLFFLYAVATTGRYKSMTRKKIIVLAIPYAVTMLLLFLSWFCRAGIFYIDTAHIYRHGVMYHSLYANMSFYVIVGVVVLLRNLRNTPRGKRNVILLQVGLLFASVVLQVRFPSYLLTASATALALTALFYVLQSPEDQINPLTGAFSRTVLPTVLQDYTDRNRDYTLVLILLRSFDELTRVHGSAAGNALLKEYSADMIERFHDQIVIFLDTSEFVVVYDGVLNRAQLETIRNNAPKRMTVDGKTVQLDVRFGALVSDQVRDTTVDIATADFIFREMRTMKNDDVLFAEASYRKFSAAFLKMEAELSRSFTAQNADLSLVPIRSKTGQVVLEEARFVLPEEAQPYVGYSQFLQTLGRSGFAWTYYEKLFHRLAGVYDSRNANRRFCLTLLPAVILNQDAPERMQTLVTACGFCPQQIVFAVSETEIAVELVLLTNNMRLLSEMGFAFMVDTFAEGYTDMSHLISLPFSYARLHESLIENADDDERAQALLKGLVSVFRDVGVLAVFPGIHTKRDAHIAFCADAPLIQGNYLPSA